MPVYIIFFYVVLLLGITIFLFNKFFKSYFSYLNCFLKNKDRAIENKLYLLFRAYLLLGCILAGSLTFIETGADVEAIETSFSLFFLSSCFLLFIARVCTTTELISAELTEERVMHHINHINFLAFFGMVTGILKILVSFNQNPKLVTAMVNTSVTVEIGFPFVCFLIQLTATPLVFSLLELVLIINRKGIVGLYSDMKHSL